tara:strand:+ start:98 stop:2095 length:1998 start_codon:yes stop_codon:yes gene_type:complete
MSSCCNKAIEEQNINGLWKRSMSLIALGGAMMIPKVEHYLLMGPASIATFGITSILMANSVINDFKDLQWFTLTSVFSLGLIIASPYFLTLSLQWLSLSFAAATLGYSLFISKDSKTSCDIKQSELEEKNTFPYSLSLPSLDKIILLSSSITWVLAAASMVSVTPILHHVMLHDALLSIGFFNFGAYIRQKLQTHLLNENHSSKVTIINELNEHTEVQLNKLKKGMRIIIDKPMTIPVSCIVEGNECKVNDDSAESSVDKKDGDNLSAFTLVHKGQVICNEDYHPIKNTSNSHNIDHPMLQMFLSSILGISLACGLFNGLVTGSLIAGVQSFAINFMSTCPCVFLVTKPIILNKALELSKKYGFEANKTPVLNKPDIIVFDRTHTLYEPNQNDSNAPYKLIDGAKELLQNLVNKGIAVYILSGHSTNGYEENLKSCRAELEKIGINPENIIFNEKFHGESSQKDEVIRNLKLYGTIDIPNSIGYLQHLKNTFYSNNVWMVGDSINDKKAIQHADLGICIGQNLSGGISINDNVAQDANLITTQANLKNLSDLVDVFYSGVNYLNVFTGFALLYNTFMLSAVNGLFCSMLGFTLSPSMACLGMSACCVSLLISASMVNLSNSDENIAQEQSFFEQISLLWNKITDFLFTDNLDNSPEPIKSTCCCH